MLDPFGWPLLNTLILLCSGTHRHLGAPCPDPRRPRRADQGPVGDDRARPAVHLRSRPMNMPMRRSASADNIYTSTFFMATGFHGFHVIVGTIFLIVCLVRAYKGHFTPRAAFRLRGGRLVLAFRRRRLAVPVPLHLRLGRLGRRISLSSIAANGAMERAVARPAGARLRGLCPRCGSQDPVRRPRHLRAEVPRLRARFRRLQRRRRAGGLPDPDRRRADRRPRHRARARRRAALVGARPALAAADRDR